MTNGNEPNNPGNDETTVVRRPDESPTVAVTPAQAGDAAAVAATQIGQPLPGQPAAPAPNPWQQQPGQQVPGQQVPQPGQPVDYGQPQPPQYGQPGQPGQQAQYGQPGQFGQQPQYGQQQFGQQPQYGQPGQFQPPAGQPQAPFGQQPQFGQAPGAPGQFTAPGADPTLNPFAPEQLASKKAFGSKGALIGIGAGVLVVIAAVIAITAFAWPGWAGKNLDQAAVQDGAVKVLTDPEPTGYGIKDVKNVECPSGQKVEVGATFTCSLTVNGENKHITITIQDSSGTYEVSRPTN